MQFMKRVFLLIAVNLLVMATLGVVFSVLVAFVPALRQAGLGPMVVLAGVFGFGGALISWLFSKQFAKWMGHLQMIDPDRAVGAERQLLQTVAKLAERAGIAMPEVGIYASPEINAFCTGPTKNDSLVAVSTGLLQRMDQDELEGVLAHELSHAGNGDMVTLTLVNGVVNTLVILISLIVTNILASQMRGERRESGWGDYFIRQMVFSLVQNVVGLLAAVAVVLPFSRWREYRADAGGAALVGKAKMIGALEALRDNFRLPRPALAAAQAASDPSLAAFKIGSLNAESMLSSHPSLDDRIERLRKLQA